MARFRYKAHPTLVTSRTKATRLENDPEIIFSPSCTKFQKDGRTVEVSIFRVETETTWHLEVINEMNTSTVWDDPFETDIDAYAGFLATVEEEGMGAFEDVPRVKKPCRKGRRTSP